MALPMLPGALRRFAHPPDGGLLPAGFGSRGRLGLLLAQVAPAGSRGVVRCGDNICDNVDPTIKTLSPSHHHVLSCFMIF